MDFSLRKALNGKPVTAETLEKLGEEVRACFVSFTALQMLVCMRLSARACLVMQLSALQKPGAASAVLGYSCAAKSCVGSFLHCRCVPGLHLVLLHLLPALFVLVCCWILSPALAPLACFSAPAQCRGLCSKFVWL